jgi:hypothetical protein
MSACHYPTLNFVEEWLVAPMSNEREKRHIDKVRDSALSMQVGDENDGSISGMVSVANTDMYIIKKHAIFRVFLADDIDPERKNISLPNGHQKISSQGSDSEIVARSFLTADALFNSNQFDGQADVKQIIDLSMAVMKELLAAQSVGSEFTRERSNALAAFQQPKHRSVALPSVEGLNERFKTSFKGSNMRLRRSIDFRSNSMTIRKGCGTASSRRYRKSMEMQMSFRSFPGRYGRS